MAENESQQFYVPDEMLSLVPEATVRKNVQYIFTSDVLESGSGFFKINFWCQYGDTMSVI